ncbi:hypothetical protein D515_04453 [Grimontia indica]|uniref:Uncharacterized protein n=1 Tax=Grimontia indica TaxID=1056512 RepID=R1GM57_9GAMM|nr:hypothetical protein [Grimontia indica]EOD77258.1 hypothetical protein D515_04453 [Grimontia indica]
MTSLKTDGQKSQILNDYAVEHLYLFKLISDWQDVAFKPKDDFTALVQARDATLSALEAAGVDSWAGYDDAMAALTDSAA